MQDGGAGEVCGRIGQEGHEGEVFGLSMWERRAGKVCG